MSNKSNIESNIDQNHNYDTHHSDPIIIPQYNEQEVTVIDYLKQTIGNPVQLFINYFISLFPIAKWILHYNLTWLYGDLIAGITVGIVLVPQSMSYAQLAGLPAEYGLYSSFIGVFTYAFFATSKDVSIGPVAVMSMQVAKAVAKVQDKHGDEFAAPVIATALSLICGGIAAGLGVLRLGFILEFISMPAVMGFMSGSAINIIAGQVPGLMGYNKLVNTRDATYLVVIHSLKHLKDSKLDAAFGLVSLFLLYLWKFLTTQGGKRYPKYKNWFFYTEAMRNAVIIVFATLISWGVIRFQGKHPSISTLGKVPAGLKHVGVMKLPPGLLSAMASEIPAATIVLLLEHIAIAKSFGRVNDYKIVPDQEIIAIGFNNLIGTFFNAYPSTGSFSRSALKAKCGVKTPLAGIFTGGVVLLAIYCFTKAFYYIPKAALSAIIIHAVSDLVAPYTVTWGFWKVSPLDCGIFLICVLVTVFSSIDNGIYFAVCASAALLLWRVAKPEGLFLGKVKIAEIIDPIIDETESEQSSASSSIENENIEISSIHLKSKDTTTKGTGFKLNSNVKFYTKWVPLNKKNIHKGLKVTPPPPGVIVFKPVETFTYPNSSKQVDKINDEVKRLTKRGIPYNHTKPGDRPWNDPAPISWKLPFTKRTAKQEEAYTAAAEFVDERPILRIIHFDFSTVASIDATSIQNIVDLQKALNIYADREVEFHFSGLLSPWVRRALLGAGFGSSGNLVAQRKYYNIGVDEEFEFDEESQVNYLPVVGTNTPFFHFDIPSYDV